MHRGYERVAAADDDDEVVTAVSAASSSAAESHEASAASAASGSERSAARPSPVGPQLDSPAGLLAPQRPERWSVRSALTGLWGSLVDSLTGAPDPSAQLTPAVRVREATGKCLWSLFFCDKLFKVVFPSTWLPFYAVFFHCRRALELLRRSFASSIALLPLRCPHLWRLRTGKLCSDATVK